MMGEELCTRLMASTATSALPAVWGRSMSASRPSSRVQRMAVTIIYSHGTNRDSDSSVGNRRVQSVFPSGTDQCVTQLCICDLPDLNEQAT